MSEETTKNVLLVEDDPAIVDIYEIIIKKSKFHLEVAALGQEAIKKVKAMAAGEEKKPDIVLLDLILPDINGIEVLREIRANEATRHIKVFVLTNQEDSHLQAMQELKPDKFIIKANITPTQLVELIKKELG